MKTRLAACGVGAVVLLGLAPATTASSRSTAGPAARVIDGSFHSRALSGTMHYAVALPPGYDTSVVGSKDPYPSFVADNQRLDRELAQAGIEHTFRIYAGAHDFGFWDAHQDAWLAVAVERLDRPA